MDTPTALQEFLQYMVGNLIQYPADAVIAHEHQGKKHVFRVVVNPSDIGRVIGKNGYTVSAIRSLLNAAAVRDGLSVVLKIEEGENEKAETGNSDGHA